MEIDQGRHEMWGDGSCDACIGEPGGRAVECCCGAPERDSRRAGKSGHGDHNVSALQWPRTKSCVEVVGNRAGHEIAASTEQAGLPGYVHLVLPMVLERARAGAG